MTSLSLIVFFSPSKNDSTVCSLISYCKLKKKNQNIPGVSAAFLTSQHRKLVPSKRHKRLWKFKEITVPHSLLHRHLLRLVRNTQNAAGHTEKMRHSVCTAAFCRHYGPMPWDLSSHHPPEPAIVSPGLFIKKKKNQTSILFPRFWTY